MENLVPPSSLVLVAVMPSPRDLEIARLLGWYRIPLRKAPKVIYVDYLAFYQTGAFGDTSRWRIEYIAEMRGHELLTREELLRDEADHPRAKEEYYKLEVGPLWQLPKPILAEKWKRITFLYTTGEYLNHAQSIQDLVVHSGERRLLWQTLRERTASGDREGLYTKEEMEIDPAIFGMMALLGGDKIGTDWLDGLD